MPGSTVPVIRQPFSAADPLPYWAYTHFTGNHCFAVADDPAEDHDLVGTAVEQQLEEQLRAALVEIDAPDDQLLRLGLA